MASISAPILGTAPRTSHSALRSLAQKIYNRINKQRAPIANGRVHSPDTVSIVCISDTHNSKPELPQGDILLHAGDLSQYGTFAEITSQIAWLRSLPHRHKIVIAGNHDLLLDESFSKTYPDRELGRKGAAKSDLHWGDVIYAEDETVTVEVRGRTLTIYGSPWTPRCGTFAFQYDPSDDIWSERLPPGADVILVHGPPALHLDNGKGCDALLDALRQTKPQLAVFGHIHSARGQQVLSHDRASVLYEDIMLGRRQWIGLCRLMLCMIRGNRKQGDAAVTTLVNAAMLTSARDERSSQGVVVEL